MRKIKTYEIVWDSNGFKQIKTIVTKEDWENLVKPIKNAIDYIKDGNRGGKDNSHSICLKNTLKDMFGKHDLYLEGSPMDIACKTGIYDVSTSTRKCVYKCKSKII